MTQRDLFNQASARDETLRQHASKHASLIAAATTFALRLARERGTVTSPEVLAEMRRNGWGAVLDATDTRWMGAVLLPSRGWERVGFVRNGSKGRPTTEWRWRGE